MDRREFLRALALAPLVLRTRPESVAAAFGARPLALVTADTESRVAAVDPASGRIHRWIETLPGPRSIETSLQRSAVVAHTAHGAVSLIDGRSLEVTAILRDFDEPRYTAASRDGRHVYVSDSGREDVAVIDLRRGAVVRRLAVGGPARHITIDTARRYVWCSLGAKAEFVVVLDVGEPARPRLVRRLRPPFLAHDVGFTPRGRRVWVTSGDRREIAVYDARADRPLFTIRADAPPQHVTFVGRHAYVTSGDDGTLRVHRLENGGLVRTTRVPTGSYNVQQGFGLVLTPSLDRGTLCVLSEDGDLLRRVQVAPSSHDACFVMSS
jgi:hypothetical protein